MAARRLLIVMLVLLGISTLVAALVPPPDERTTSTTDTTPERTSDLPPGGELVRVSIDADSPRVERVGIPLGDQLALEVRSRRPGEIQIRRLGLLEDVAPGAPARFNILAQQAGRFEVRRVDRKERLADLVVEAEDG